MIGSLHPDSEELSPAILLGQDRVVEMLALGVPVAEVLREICETANRRFGGVRCAILRPDEKRGQLAVAAAAGFAGPMIEALDGLPLGRAEEIFPALFALEPHYVESIAREPAMAPLASAAATCGVSAAWSIGLRSPGQPEGQCAEGLLLFVLEGERRPGARGVRVLEMLARLAALALDRDRLTRGREQDLSIDPLTRLPNRVLFDRLLADLVELATPGHTRFAVVLLDLDDFLAVNRAFGFRTGNLLLRSFARRLRHALRQGDIAARFEGDRFALLVRLEDVVDEARKMAERLRGVVRQAFEFGGQEIAVTASLGLALYPWDGVDPNTLLGHAELALRAAQTQGGDRVAHFSPAVSAAPARATPPEGLEVMPSAERFRLSELELHWEPVLQLSTQRLVGLMALASWQRADGGRLAGADLWRAAARAGELSAANRGYLRRAFEEVAAWGGAGAAELVVALPLLGPQLADGGLVATFRELLAWRRGVAERIELLLPSHGGARDVEAARELRFALAGTGLRVALSDLGGGPLPVEPLLERPVWRWRLDPGLVREAPRHPEKGELLAGLVAFAHRLGAVVEAAGVENPRDLGWLLVHRCDWASGRALRAPLDHEQVRAAVLESTAK